eukprot:CAMPEP_0172453476 /NCGR_PEP_ID=MMETSP1065-20121228/10774_1 /TAXON_ID=265537 /ORGANISM="Amphiprora paludosa, Strain CCMP125" /LENGTH=871 /DNA_ID=CAMNT_0013205659 /DNA_START=63 /DNA_END=2678 /DNA_ORIENTATION=-
MMKTNNLLSITAWLCLASYATALFAEDAGQLDFLISTAGHQETNWAHLAMANLVLTTDATSTLGVPAATSSCYLAAREIATGTLAWRRNVCSSTDAAAHAVAALETSVVTLDKAGAVRAWDATTGALNWEISLPAESNFASIYTVGGTAVVIQGADGSTTASLDATTGKALETPVSGDLPAVPATDHAVCSDVAVSTGPDQKSLVAHVQDKAIDLDSSELAFSEDDLVEGLHLLSCDSAMTLLVASVRGTTFLVSIDLTNQPYQASVAWTAEEGLASITTGLLLDASHYVEEMVDETGASAAQLLSFSSRLAMHGKALSQAAENVALFLTGDTSGEFGFEKVAILISSHANRLYGMYTTGPKRSTAKYQYDLPATADWHRVVHGLPNAYKNVRGINGKAHTKDILVVSSSEGEVSWLCVEGATGQIHGKGSIEVSSPVSQVVPIAGGAKSSCRQGAMLVLQDLTTAVLPDDDTKALAASQVATSGTFANGFFAHRLDKESATLESLQLAASDNQSVNAQVLGMAHFPGEKIVSVAYPYRDEVIQSPCNVLGDQSLLLKYLNPHLVVVMTMTADESADSGKDLYTSALKSANTDTTSKQKRKPAGAGSTEAAPLVEEDPNLFVNVLDSVSGRVLYRASHSNAVLTPNPSMLVSENWIFYSFMNARTRRAEIGVLSLYEGMIDSKGLNALATPDQMTEFSSLDARESKPVVLAKTYSLAKPVTAMGITASRSGISSKKLIFASMDGQVYSVDRKMLEPRRPMGQVKDAEKEEGLRQYSELIPMITYLSLSYTQSVEGVQQIVSAPTDLESQTLVLAFGGPDIFFARTSPSRGFDLLPDSFNRVMLSVVVIVLITGALVLQRIVFSKTVQKGWV